MSAEWHYSKSGNSFGPVSGQQLKQFAASGELQPTDLVWKEGMPEWRPVGEVRGLMPSATPPVSKGPPQPRRARKQPTNLWKILVIVGGGLLFIELFVPWWGISVDPDNAGIADAQRLVKVFRNNESWYRQYDGAGGDFDQEQRSAWLWGWSTGLGITGFVFRFFILTAAILPMCLSVVRPWAWPGMFAAAIMGLILFIMSLVWIFSAPGENVGGFIRQGIIAGPYLVLVASLLILPSAVLEGVTGLLRFIREINARRSVPSLEGAEA